MACTLRLKAAVACAEQRTWVPACGEGRAGLHRRLVDE